MFSVRVIFVVVVTTPPPPLNDYRSVHDTFPTREPSVAMRVIHGYCGDIYLFQFAFSNLPDGLETNARIIQYATHTSLSSLLPPLHYSDLLSISLFHIMPLFRSSTNYLSPSNRFVDRRIIFFCRSPDCNSHNR